MGKRFILEYWIDEGWYVGKLKEVPGVFSQGETLEELEENIKEAYQLMMNEEDFCHLKKCLRKSWKSRFEKKRVHQRVNVSGLLFNETWIKT